MKLHRICAVPVVNQLGEYIGCICEEDILNEAVPEYMKSIYDTSFMANVLQIVRHLKSKLEEKASVFVDKDYPVIAPDDSISYAADLLYRTKRNILPVVENKILIGFITRTEILSVSLD